MVFAMDRDLWPDLRTAPGAAAFADPTSDADPTAGAGATPTAGAGPTPTAGPGGSPRPDAVAVMERLRLVSDVLDRLPAMVAYWDRDCRNVLANSAYKEWFGIEPKDMVGRHIREVLGEPVYRMNLPHIEAALAGREQHFERTLIDTSGAVRHTQAWYSPDTVDGRTRGFYVLVTEVTAQVEAERASRRNAEQYRALARNIPGTFVLLFDRDLRYNLAEGEALQAFHLVPEAVEGFTLWEVLPDRAAEIEPHYRAALAGRNTTWHRHLDGRIFSLTAAPVRDAEGLVFAGLVIGTDVTAARRRETTDRALRRIAAATADGASVEHVCNLVANAVLEIFDADTSGVSRFSADKMEIVAMEPPLPIERLSTMAPDDDSAVGRLYRSGDAEFVHYGGASRGRARSIADIGLVAGAAAPIRVNGALWGAVGLGLRRPVGSEEEEREILGRIEDFAAAVTTSISSSAAWDALAALAVTDVLTGLANRRYFDDHLDRAVRSGRRHGYPVSLVLLDLDRFKEVNDTLGHQAGDAVLAEAARRMSEVVRSGEVLARIGGDEFALLLAQTGAEEAAETAARLCRTLAEHPIGAHGVTVTAGVATGAGPGLAADTLYARADADLYRNKRDRPHS